MNTPAIVTLEKTKYTAFLRGLLYINNLKRKARLENGTFLFEGALKLKLGISLLCMLVFVAAVDTIPDPPAINPPASDGCNISAVHDRGPFSLFEKEWLITPESLQRMQLNWFFTRFSFDDRPAVVCLLSLIYHAADTSPPIFS